MNPLVIRKQLLQMEAEVYRCQMAEDWSVARSQLQVGRNYLGRVGLFASAGTVGWTLLHLLRRPGRVSTKSHSPWVRAAFQVVKLASWSWPMWKAIRQSGLTGHRASL